MFESQRLFIACLEMLKGPENFSRLRIRKSGLSIQETRFEKIITFYLDEFQVNADCLVILVNWTATISPYLAISTDTSSTYLLTMAVLLNTGISTTRFAKLFIFG